MTRRALFSGQQSESLAIYIYLRRGPACSVGSRARLSRSGDDALGGCSCGPQHHTAHSCLIRVDELGGHTHLQLARCAAAIGARVREARSMRPAPHARTMCGRRAAAGGWKRETDGIGGGAGAMRSRVQLGRWRKAMNGREKRAARRMQPGPRHAPVEARARLCARSQCIANTRALRGRERVQCSA